MERRGIILKNVLGKSNSQPFLLEILWGKTSPKWILNYTLHLIKHENPWPRVRTHRPLLDCPPSAARRQPGDPGPGTQPGAGESPARRTGLCTHEQAQPLCTGHWPFLGLGLPLCDEGLDCLRVLRALSWDGLEMWHKNRVTESP